MPSALCFSADLVPGKRECCSYLLQKATAGSVCVSQRFASLSDEWIQKTGNGSPSIPPDQGAESPVRQTVANQGGEVGLHAGEENPAG